MSPAREPPPLHRVAGRSMAPFLQAGDLLRWEPCSLHDLEDGQIALIREQGRNVAHRVIGRAAQDAFMTMGDGNLQAEFVPSEHILGRVVQIRRGAWLLHLDSGRRSDSRDALIRSLRARHALHARGLWGARRAWFHRLLTRRLNLRRALCTVRLDRIEEPAATRAALLDRFRALAGIRQAGPAPGHGPDVEEALARHGLDVLDARARGDAQRMRSAGFEYIAVRRTLEEVCEAFRQARLSFVVLKGLPLASDLYGTDPVRPSSDLDVLVRPRDRERAAHALLSRGWRATVGTGLRRVLHRIHFHEAYVPGGPMLLPVELHWHLEDAVNLHRIDDAELWSRIDERGGVGRLSAGDELLYLCLHAARHALFHADGLRTGAPPAWFVASDSGARLIWYLDVQRHLEAHAATLDWPDLGRRILRWNIGDEVSTVLRVLDLLLPGSHARAAIAHLGIEPAAAASDPAAGPGACEPPAALPSALPGLVIRPQRLAAVCALLFPSPQQLVRFWRMPRSLLLLLYLLHPFRMALRLAGYRH